MREQLITLNAEIGQPVVSSRDVAKRFNKQHKDVLESIRNLSAENSAVCQMFHAREYLDAKNRAQPEYLMNRDGFSLLVMGFTGKEALTWKVKYIEAFNKMEKQLQAEQLRLAAGPKQDARLLEAQSRLMNSRTEQAKLLISLADKAYQGYDRSCLYGCAVAVLGGQEITGRRIETITGGNSPYLWLKE